MTTSHAYWSQASLIALGFLALSSSNANAQEKVTTPRYVERAPDVFTIDSIQDPSKPHKARMVVPGSQLGFDATGRYSVGQWIAPANSNRLLASIAVNQDGKKLLLECYQNGVIKILDSKGKTLSVTQPKQSSTWVNKRGEPKITIKRKSAAATKRVATLDVVVSPVPEPLAAYIDRDCEDMVVILDAKKGGAAAKAGLRKHDIIVRIDGNDELSNNKLAKVIANKEPGSEVKVEVLRRGEKSEHRVKLGSKVKAKGNYLLWPGNTKSVHSYRGLPSPSAPTGLMVDKNGQWDILKSTPNAYFFDDGSGKRPQRVQLSVPKNKKLPTTTKWSKDSGKSIEGSIRALIQELQEQRKRVDSTLERLQKIEKRNAHK